MSKNRCCCNCEVDGHYIGYVQCFTGWCKRWASDAKDWEKKKGQEA